MEGEVLPDAGQVCSKKRMSVDEIKAFIKNNLLELREDEGEAEVLKLSENNGIKGKINANVLKFYKAEKKEHEQKIKKLNEEIEKKNNEEPDLREAFKGIITANDKPTQVKQIKEHLSESWLDAREDEAFLFIKEICDAFVLDAEIKNIIKSYYKVEKKEYISAKETEKNTDDADPLNIDYDESEIDPDIKLKADMLADKILERGDPIKYIINTIKKKHVGDEKTEEGICISIAGQCCTNTAGIQIVVNGESGSGKSDGTKKHLHLVPRKWKRTTSLSAKALYYMKLKPGMIIFSDDTNMDPELEEVFKQSTTNYQETTFRTTVKDQENLTISIPARINLFLTCVQSNVSDQALNRQLVFETDDGPEQKNKIFEMQRKLEADGINHLEVTRRVLICRRIYSKLKENLFNVRIPYAERIELEDKSNSRVFPLLSDMIKGYAIFRWKQRKIDEYGNLIAEIDDFERAKVLFNSRVENTMTKLTKVETVIVKDIILNQNKCGGVGCSISEISERTEIKYHTVGRLIEGRKDRDDGGLLSKVKGMKREDTTSTEYIRETDGEGHSTLVESKGRKAIRYRIENSDIWGIFKSEFITLKPEK